MVLKHLTKNICLNKLNSIHFYIFLRFIQQRDIGCLFRNYMGLKKRPQRLTSDKFFGVSQTQIVAPEERHFLEKLFGKLSDLIPYAPSNSTLCNQLPTHSRSECCKQKQGFEK